MLWKRPWEICIFEHLEQCQTHSSYLTNTCWMKEFTRFPKLSCLRNDYLFLQRRCKSVSSFLIFWDTDSAYQRVWEVLSKHLRKLSNPGIFFHLSFCQGICMNIPEYRCSTEHSLGTSGIEILLHSVKLPVVWKQLSHLDYTHVSVNTVLSILKAWKQSWCGAVL